MGNKELDRRDFLKSVLAGIPLLALDWDSFARGEDQSLEKNEFDAIVVGSGLGGLSCAAAFARQGFKALVLEQHYVPGGYATTFKRRGFEFDVSLHSTSVPERDGVHNLIPGFPEITDIKFEPHPYLYRAIFPGHDMRVPQSDVSAYVGMLVKAFPAEKEGIEALIGDMHGITKDARKFSAAGGAVDMSRFPVEFPDLFNCHDKTWGQLVDARLNDNKLKAIVSALWGYYGLPPSKLASMYYALPTYGYLEDGGYYPVGRSQRISNALVSFIEERGGEVKLKTPVEQILTKDQTAYGVKTKDGQQYTGRVVVSNANALDTLHKMLQDGDFLKEYLDRLDGLQVSLSSFQLFLGLKKDMVGEAGITDSEVFYAAGYDVDASYSSSLAADVENCDFGVTMYDNVCKGYSPPGKNTVNVITLQGYDHWEKYEEDYFKGNKAAYNAEKEKMAGVLIKRVESALLPGLKDAIEVIEIGTPLTNLRYTGNYRGAIYGFDQTVDNSGASRLAHNTPVKNLYLAGAWTRPGHGYSAVLWSGLSCFNEIMQSW